MLRSKIISLISILILLVSALNVFTATNSKEVCDEYLIRKIGKSNFNKFKYSGQYTSNFKLDTYTFFDSTISNNAMIIVYSKNNIIDTVKTKLPKSKKINPRNNKNNYMFLSQNQAIKIAIKEFPKFNIKTAIINLMIENMNQIDEPFWSITDKTYNEKGEYILINAKTGIVIKGSTDIKN